MHRWPSNLRLIRYQPRCVLDTTRAPHKQSWGRMRKQYHFWPGEGGLHARDVDRLIELSRGLSVREVPLESIWEVDTVYWFNEGNERPTVRKVVEHIQLVHEVDPSHPIILGVDGRVMDGMHRIALALLEGRSTINAVQFLVQPEPDYRDCSPEDLPY
jgi:hypothetical protein